MYRGIIGRWVALLLAAPLVIAQDQTPLIFDVSEVTVGAHKIATQYLYTVGKWSDADKTDGTASTAIECFEKLGFCNVATSHFSGFSSVNLDTFDILRWDDKEMIAVDSSPICMVNGSSRPEAEDSAD